MSRGTYKWALAIAFVYLAAVPAEAQNTESSRRWIAIGGAWTTLQGACGEGCDLRGEYRHTGTFLANAGYRVNSRMDTGAEIFWASTDLAGGDSLRSTFVLAAAQFRPWESRGFSLKAGMGMAFVRNWVYDITNQGGGPPYTSKALGLTYGAGWTFRHTQRLSVQIFGAQHVASLGDLETSVQTYENVVGNFWSLGATLVIR